MVFNLVLDTVLVFGFWFRFRFGFGFAHLRLIRQFLLSYSSTFVNSL
jgi:hypothetical protein